MACHSTRVRGESIHARALSFHAVWRAKLRHYPESPEVEVGKVYKLRSSSYVKSGSEYYFGRVDFEDGLSLTEIRSRNRRQEYDTLPTGLSEPEVHDAWNKIKPEENDHFDSSLIRS